MSDTPQPLRVLASRAAAKKLNRRTFLTGLAAAAAMPALSACAGSSQGSGGGSGSDGMEGELSIYTWGQYDNPKTFKDFTASVGPKVSIDSYDSNEEMISKLAAAKGTSGYDLIVPTGPYIPEMVAHDLLLELDHSKLPNLRYVNKEFLGRGWDPQNKYSVCKDWGTVGYIYDTTKIQRELKTWNDFFDAAANEASGQTSVLDDPSDFTGMYFWAHNLDWNTTDKSQLDACQNFLVNKLAPHIKAFDAYPGSGGAMAKDSYSLMEAYNGDARQGFMAVKNPKQYKWVLPLPTEIWMDNWAIAKGAPDPNAAHAFINFVLNPANSLRELEFIGYDTGIKNIEPKAQQSGTPFLDMVFLSDSDVAKMQEGKINSATQRHVAMLNAVKAAAAG